MPSGARSCSAVRNSMSRLRAPSAACADARAEGPAPLQIGERGPLRAPARRAGMHDRGGSARDHRLAQQPLQPVPGGQDLPQRSFADDAAVTVDGDAFRHLDAEIARAERGNRFLRPHAINARCRIAMRSANFAQIYTDVPTLCPDARRRARNHRSSGTPKKDSAPECWSPRRVAPAAERCSNAVLECRVYRRFVVTSQLQNVADFIPAMCSCDRKRVCQRFSCPRQALSKKRAC